MKTIEFTLEKDYPVYADITVLAGQKMKCSKERFDSLKAKGFVKNEKKQESKN